MLVCREMCIPGKAHLSLALPVKSAPPAADARSAAWFAEARKSLPRPAPANWNFFVADANGTFVLTAKVGHPVTAVSFFPLAESQVSNAAGQLLMPDESGFRLTLPKSDQLLKPIERLRGVIVLPDERAYTIDVPIGKRSVTNAKGRA